MFVCRWTFRYDQGSLAVFFKTVGYFKTNFVKVWSKHAELKKVHEMFITLCLSLVLKALTLCIPEHSKWFQYTLCSHTFFVCIPLASLHWKNTDDSKLTFRAQTRHFLQKLKLGLLISSYGWEEESIKDILVAIVFNVILSIFFWELLLFFVIYYLLLCVISPTMEGYMYLYFTE